MAAAPEGNTTQRGWKRKAEKKIRDSNCRYRILKLLVELRCTRPSSLWPQHYTHIVRLSPIICASFRVYSFCFRLAQNGQKYETYKIRSPRGSVFDRTKTSAENWSSVHVVALGTFAVHARAGVCYFYIKTPELNSFLSCYNLFAARFLAI